MPMPNAPTGVSELIRLAEKQISAGNLARACELLSNARSLEPSNEYISAIMERVLRLDPGPDPVNPPDAASGDEPGPPDGDEIQNQVRRLTDNARSLFARGAFETAFNTLMKAYFLDPVSPEVMKAEELIVPALERVRQPGTLSAPAPDQPGGARILRDHVAAGMPQDSLPAARPSDEAPRKAHGGFFARLRKGSLLG